MIERWAMVRNGVVENVINWDGLLTTWQPPAGIEMVKADDWAGIGWTWDGEKFTAPVVAPTE